MEDTAATRIWRGQIEDFLAQGVFTFLLSSSTNSIHLVAHLNPQDTCPSLIREPLVYVPSIGSQYYTFYSIKYSSVRYHCLTWYQSDSVTEFYLDLVGNVLRSIQQVEIEVTLLHASH